MPQMRDDPAEVVDPEKSTLCRRRYVGHLVPLAFLAPEIVAAILGGEQPLELTAQALTKRADVPWDWNEQKRRFGFV